MSSIEECTTKRGNIKAQITRLFTHFKQLTLENAVIENIETRVSRLESLFLKYDTVQSEIENSCTNKDNIESTREDRFTVEEKYFEAKSTASRLIKKLRKLETPEPLPSKKEPCISSSIGLNEAIKTIADNQAALTSLLSNNRSDLGSANISDEFQVHQKLDIPTFSGNYNDWPEFQDSFNKLIHNSSKYSDGMKLQFLKKSLTGKAKDIFKNLPATDANYKEAYQELIETYNKSDLIIDAYLKNIFEHKKLHTATADGLRVLCNSVTEAVRALKALGQPTEHWDAFLVYSFSSKLDDESQKLWRRECNKSLDNLPKFSELVLFVKNRIYELSVFKDNRFENKSTRNFEHTPRTKLLHAAIIDSASCIQCGSRHGLYACPEFLKMSVTARRELVKQKKVCFNCLKSSHIAKSCPSKNTCKICSKHHNTLVHDNQQHSAINNSPNNIEAVPRITSTLTTHTVTESNEHYTSILPTAIVLVKHKSQNFVQCRILLDTGSQASLITNKFVQNLQLKPSFDKRAIQGIGSSSPVTYTKGIINITLFSRINNYQVSTEALVVDKLTSLIPNVRINPIESVQFSNIELADPSYNMASKIDMIVGSDIFFRVLQEGKIIISPNHPIAVETKFGWVVTGRSQTDQNTMTYSLHSCIEIESALKKFWEVEELQSGFEETIEEKLAEEHFSKTHYRDETGRYVVRLPFKDDVKLLGDSRKLANQRLLSMERKFEKDVNLKLQYSDFMKEYEQLNHMVKVSNNENLSKNGFYLPHHGVVKSSSTTTKLRVVFNASQKSTTNVSLNDLLLVGPTIQKDIFCLLLNFRKHLYAYVADIAKMYRQVLVHRADTPFQKILWRYSKDDTIQEYELITVTYGTASAPFLAIRCLKQLAIDEGQAFPIGATNLIENFYVDDFIGSSHSLLEALEVKQQLQQLLRKGGFDLRKWSSNSKSFLNTIDKDQQESVCVLPREEDISIKTLGMQWVTEHDCFKFQVNIESITSCTKRVILSEISKLYDPLGFLAPCVVYVKMLLQEMWIIGCDWDDSLPENLTTRYINFRTDMASLSNLKIPRWLNITNQCTMQLCGFSDASEKAYAASVYLRVVCKGKVYVELVAAKTKVAPIKQISLPRLELCGAHLLSKLINKVKIGLQYPDVELVAFTDSTIVLAWLRELPRKWKNFIANRTSSIQSAIPYKNWQYVKSSNNPADIASRGMLPSKIVNNELWWKGPKFLHNLNFNINLSSNKHHETQEEARLVNTVVIQHKNRKQLCNYSIIETLFDRYSTLVRIQRIVGYILHYISNCKASAQNTKFNKRSSLKILSNSSLKEKVQKFTLTVKALQNSLKILIKVSQMSLFQLEISNMLKNQSIPHTSCLNQLDPFLDDDGILRVGGRLQNAIVHYDKKHPIILHRPHKLSLLIVHNIHLKYFHAGQQLLLNIIHFKYWIIGCKQLVRSHIYKCTTCLRFRSTTAQQQMGQLPSFRVRPSRPFANTGTDFAGPFTVKTWKGRGAKTLKSYIAIFVCAVTRALHLELVSDLSTEMFLAALHRFMARRGFCNNIYSDNGRNYIGAARKLSEVTSFLRDNSSKIATKLSENEIQWHFIPVYTPHFGGLWESAVKSVKTHLRTVIGTTILTQEEMQTTLCQVEACLNSRPIAPKSFDIDDLEALTPGHFLVQSSLLLPPQECQDINSSSHSSRWQLLQRIMQHFWKRWSMDYMSNLQLRKKWKHPSNNLKVNDLVLVKEDNLPPCSWLLGRIMSTKPGADGLVRVVNLKTKCGNIERPIHKCILLAESSNQ